MFPQWDFGGLLFGEGPDTPEHIPAEFNNIAIFLPKGPFFPYLYWPIIDRSMPGKYCPFHRSRFSQWILLTQMILFEIKLSASLIFVLNSRWPPKSKMAVTA
jgi:hypothetical protein